MDCKWTFKGVAVGGLLLPFLILAACSANVTAALLKPQSRGSDGSVLEVSTDDGSRSAMLRKVKRNRKRGRTVRREENQQSRPKEREAEGL